MAGRSPMRLHWRTAELDARVARIPERHCNTASWKAGNNNGQMTQLLSRPLWKAFYHSTRWSRAGFPISNINASDSRRFRWRTTKINVSVSSAMQRHSISMVAVYTEYASGTQNTCRNRSREDCTLSRVEGVAQNAKSRSRSATSKRVQKESYVKLLSTKCAKGSFPLTNAMLQ